jgi:hypothetical protein
VAQVNLAHLPSIGNPRVARPKIARHRQCVLIVLIVTSALIVLIVTSEVPAASEALELIVRAKLDAQILGVSQRHARVGRQLCVALANPVVSMRWQDAIQ